MNKKAVDKGITPKLQDRYALIISAVAALGYFLYSKKSVGYYQHDEIAHLMNMYEFWDNPAAILGNWPKTGYKLVYALPALLGTKFLVWLNCAFAALGSFLAYKTVTVFDRRYALLAAVLVATQPMWIELSFRNYADSFSGILLVAALLAHYKERWIIAGLILSFGTLVRQEFFLIAIPYGLYLLAQRRWLAAVLMGSFPFLYNLWGAVVTGDPLYLISSSKETSDLYGEQFSRHGFFHFWRMSFVVWGAVTTVLAVLFTSIVINATRQKKLKEVFEKNPYFALIPVLIYLLIHSLFNWDAIAIGASPNLRYMNAIGPVLAVMAVLGITAWDKVKSDSKLHLGVLAVTLILYAMFAAYGHNGVVLTEESDYSLFFFGVLCVVFLLINLASISKVMVFSGLAMISGFLPLQPKKLSPEDESIAQIVKWIGKEKKDHATLFTNHNVVPYYYDKQLGQLPEDMKSLDSAAIVNAPVGSLLIVESHYSLRLDFPPPAEYIRAQYLQDRDFQKVVNSILEMNQGNYDFAKQFVAKDQRFVAFVFEKVK